MPEDQSCDVDVILRAIARDISYNEDIENLGKGLGFTVAECQNFIKTNYRHLEITNEGTVCMLRKWSKGVSPSSLRSDLREALKRARLVRIAEIHLPLGLPTRIAIYGEAGVGKTTFLAKLALDWALGRRLKTIDLVFLIHLREIEESTCFGDTIMGNLSDELEIEGLELDEYIRTNQQQVLILYDGLDEYAKEISKSASNDDAAKDDATIAVIRGEKFKNVRVIVTTRPWKKERIKSDTKLEKQYTFVEIEGFKPDDVSCYISKFFHHNEEARNSLISLMTDKDSLVAQNMAPYPIYCSMLCFIWQNEGNRSVIQGLETFANFFDELIHHLKVHFAGKETDEKAQKTKLVRGDDCLQNFGKDALSNLLRNQLVFGEKDLTVSDVDVKTACEIGVLTREEHFVSRRENNKRRTMGLVEYRIPHKLFQEYLAGLHLAWLYENNPEEFNQLSNKLIEDFENFSYLLYFTAAQGVDVGKAVLSSLCKMLPDEEKLEFIIDVAFECHRLDALQPLIPYLNEKKSLSIRGPYHTASGWVYAWEACGYFASECSEYRGLTEKDNSTAIAARNAGRGICLLSNLTSLDLTTIQLHEDFFTGMSSMASQSKLESISHGGGPDLSAAASQAYAKSICTMPNLKALRLFDVSIADNFFISLAESAPGARLESISHGEGPDISATAAQAYAKSICTMPNLQSLELHSIGFADDFFLTLAASASGARLESIRHNKGPELSTSASMAYAKSVCTMPNLQTLKLDDVGTTDDFYLTLADLASGAK
ncbi:NLR family CARD domain-containing protein 4-like, partial [Diadema antillarum]|uniref:NLR family CARD domain-containing protein 4-like n=1 Tax=Diadema antillarum TaxID=105358 RepID=UPI003A84B39E